MRAESRVLLGAETVRRPAPLNLRDGDEQFFAHEYERVLGPTLQRDLGEVVVLPNGYLVRGGRLLSEGFTSPPRGVRALKARARTLGTLLRTRETRLGKGLWITDEFSNGFFHWVCDVLPRLEILDDATRRETALLVPAMADLGYVEDSLAAYGIPDVRRLSWRDRVSCRELSVVGPAAPTGNFRPSLMNSLRERMRAHHAARGQGRRIYISRAGAAVRRVSNEAEVVPILENLGFEIIMTERLSFAEQVRLVGSASVLVSNHGAGLTHMCWMSPGTTVLELRRRADRWNNCYFSLAGALGIAYRYLSCRVVDERLPTHTADLVVDTRALADALAQAA